ncbi:MAG: DUF3224 domain-containing protein [Gemmatimonadaceae bacterium]|nr:DUF3224 domain-containing protein [Gemmatimonadaceae bacterium]
MTQRATGTFDVNLVPLAAAHGGEGTPLARMSIDKRFSGDLEGTSAGEMLGIAGSLQIVIENKQHSYIFQYTLDGAP